jgi:hypothetical protein
MVVCPDLRPGTTSRRGQYPNANEVLRGSKNMQCNVEWFARWTLVVDRQGRVRMTIPLRVKSLQSKL